MRILLLAALVSVLGLLAAQGISYDSLLCISVGLIKTPNAAMSKKYQTMVTNLNKDTTLKAQITRATNFINNNWKDLNGISEKALVPSFIDSAKSRLEKRWALVAALKELLAKIKPKLGAAKFEEIRKLLWTMDKEAKNNVFKYYEFWKEDAIKAIPAAAKKTEITNVISAWESTDAFPKFEADMRGWVPGKGYRGCF